MNPDILNPLAESYVKLLLALGKHDIDSVDAYYGPAQWKAEIESSEKSLSSIQSEAVSLRVQLQSIDSSSWEETLQLRHKYLWKQLGSLIARAEMLGGKKLPFDEECLALYDVVPPSFTVEHFQSILNRIDALLPGEGNIPDRLTAFRDNFVVPTEKLDIIFTTAIRECRRRTKEHIALPSNENFRIEYVANKPWSGYNWYQGEYQSLIQVNTDLPTFVDRAIDLAAHEGYPGHHVYNVLLEEHLVKKRQWLEFTIYPLFSSQSLIAEGTANYGVEVVFPEAQKLQYEKDVLFPMAGLNAEYADQYDSVMKLVKQLDYAGNEAARKYLDGKVTAEEAIRWLEDYALAAPERAEHRIQFFDRYRSYVINYNFGEDLVKGYIESQIGESNHQERRWAEFKKLLASPRLASALI